jgi:hypothetical protein
MAHKVRVDVSFSDLEQYQLMKSQLDGVNLKFDTFVTYCVDHVWNQMLEEHKRQLAEESRNAISRNESTGDTVTAPAAEGLGSSEQADGQAAAAQEG